ncbi:MAG: CpaF family protein [Deltaproteobacteria bacterium]|nr:CpaF family protein [Deltaproteobacteria bacterium]
MSSIPTSEVQAKNALRQRLVRNITQTPSLTGDRTSLEASALEIAHRLGREGYAIDAEARQRIAAAVVDDILGWGPLQPLFDDPTITEIMINGPDVVFAERGGQKKETGIKFDDEAHLRHLIEKMLRPTGKRLDEMVPFADISLPDGSRVNVIIPPVVVGGPHVTIRCFLRSIRTLEDLVRLGTMDARMARFLWACIHSHQSMIFAGSTGTGKTTLLEILSGYIDHDERIVTIEDTLELTLEQPNVARLLTRAPNLEGKGEITPQELFRNSLRMRPTRILLGELRGREAAEFLQALNSGHRGSLAVLHAASPEQTLLRLEHLVLLSLGNVPLNAIRSQIACGLQILVQLVQHSDGVRRVTHIVEVDGVGVDGEVQVRDVFRYEEATEAVEEEDAGKHGKFVATGYVPRCLEEMKRLGLKIDERVFAAG